MNFQVFIFGRTKNIDYRVLCVPTIEISSNTKKLVSQLINMDVPTNGTIIGSRFLFVKDTGYVLMGKGFLNESVISDKNYSFDFSGKRYVRSFVGIVMTEEDFSTQNQLPLADDFYINLYLKYISQIWDVPLFSQKNSKPITSDIHDEIEKEDWTIQNGINRFNKSPNFCHIFPRSEVNSILSSLRLCQSNIMLGLNNLSHITTAYRRFGVCIQNAVVLDVEKESDLQFQTSKPHIHFREEEIHHERIKFCHKKCKNIIRRFWERGPKLWFESTFGDEAQLEDRERETQENFAQSRYDSEPKKNDCSLPAFLDGISVLSPIEEKASCQQKPDTMVFDWGDDGLNIKTTKLTHDEEEPLLNQKSNECEIGHLVNNAKVGIEGKRIDAIDDGNLVTSKDTEEDIPKFWEPQKNEEE